MLVLLVAALVGGPVAMTALLAIVDGGSEHDFLTIFLASVGTNGLIWGLNSVAIDRVGQLGVAAGGGIAACLLLSWLCNTPFVRAVIAGLIYGFAMAFVLQALLPGAGVNAKQNRPLASVECAAGGAAPV